jgi:putative salt-induced outer membrane protein YdiY
VTANWLGSGRYDHFVDAQDRRFVYARSSVMRDQFQDIRRETTLGGGYGWQIVDDGLTDFSVRGGVDAVSLKRYSGGNSSYPAFGWSVNFSRWMWKHRVQAFHDQDGYWNLSDRAHVTLRTRTGLRLPVAHGFLASAELDLDWTRRPAQGYKPTESTLLLGAGYE